MNLSTRIIAVALAAVCAGCASHPSAVRCDRHLEPINPAAAKEAPPPEGRSDPPAPVGRRP